MSDQMDVWSDMYLLFALACCRYTQQEHWWWLWQKKKTHTTGAAVMKVNVQCSFSSIYQMLMLYCWFDLPSCSLPHTLTFDTMLWLIGFISPFFLVLYLTPEFSLCNDNSNLATTDCPQTSAVLNNLNTEKRLKFCLSTRLQELSDPARRK